MAKPMWWTPTALTSGLTSLPAGASWATASSAHFTAGSFEEKMENAPASPTLKKVGPGLVFLLFEHAFLGRGIILQTVTPLEPLLQNVVHTIYYQKNMPAIIPKFILRAECIQVKDVNKIL
ncbi:hypothetical protein llap_14902 [Limosa lapponica baueri]|uniref:Uncharacterized protein n=1 Tax=Limosa lapponica baueri TaxID=1758121 RepID=A0A2I0TLV7_LIMLA|nr:hypothetical protein llap_14902 [Limosa lapponica baueri]